MGLRLSSGSSTSSPSPSRRPRRRRRDAPGYACGATLFGLMLGHQWETTRRLQHVPSASRRSTRAVDPRGEAVAAASYKEALAKGDLEKPLLEEEAERERRMAHADRRLNHVIKGSVGAALTSVEIAELLLAEGRPAADLKPNSPRCAPRCSRRSRGCRRGNSLSTSRRDRTPPSPPPSTSPPRSRPPPAPRARPCASPPTRRR